MNSKFSRIGVARTAIAAGAVAIFAVAAYWYWSPFVAIRQMQSAARSRDAQAFNEKVDYPRLRESLKTQFTTFLTEQVEKTAESRKAFASLGMKVGMAMVNPMVDAMVRPETVMLAMHDGKMKSGKAARQNAGNVKKETEWDYERVGVDKLVIFPVDKDKTREETVGLVFERSGFATWKLTALALPKSKQTDQTASVSVQPGA